MALFIFGPMCCGYCCRYLSSPRVCHHAEREPATSLELFWDGFKAGFWRGLAVLALTLVIITVNVSNLWAYSSAEGLWVDIMRVVWISALGLWGVILLYLWPIWEHMEHPTLWGGLRNSAIMALRHPLFSLLLGLCVLLILGISTALAPLWMLLTGSACAALAHAAVTDRLKAAKSAD
jgi:uncharacterized membrane protein YesL